MLGTAAGVGEAGGALSRNEVYRRVGGRRWGPGRFQNALHPALDGGRIVRAGRASYGPGDRENQARVPLHWPAAGRRSSAG